MSKNTQLCEKAIKTLHFAIYICIWRCVFFLILQLKQHSTAGWMQEPMWESNYFCLSESEKWVKALVTQVCLTLCKPMDCSALPVGLPRQEHWSGLPLPSLRLLPDPGVSCAAGRLLPSESPGRPKATPTMRLEPMALRLGLSFCLN